MRKLMIGAVVALTLGLTAKPADANQSLLLRGAGIPVELKIMTILVGAMTASVILNALVVSIRENRPLTLTEGQYAALLPFLWVIQPLIVQEALRQRARRQVR